MTDRITEIVIRFENEDGSEISIRTCKMEPSATLIKATTPQGKVPGTLMVTGPVLEQRDRG